MGIKEKFNYLKGLIDGLNIGKKSKEDIALHNIVVFLEEISSKMEELEEENIRLKMLISAIEYEIEEIRDAVFEDEEEEVEEIVCVNCGKTIFIPSSQDKVVCPKCETINIHN